MAKSSDEVFPDAPQMPGIFSHTMLGRRVNMSELHTAE